MQEMQENWVQSLGQEDPLEEEMATHSSILAWKIPWTEEPAGLQSMGSQTVRQDWVTHTYIHTHMVKNDESMCSDWTQIPVWACNMTFSPQRSEFLFIFCKIQ